MTAFKYIRCKHEKHTHVNTRRSRFEKTPNGVCGTGTRIHAHLESTAEGKSFPPLTPPDALRAPLRAAHAATVLPEQPAASLLSSGVLLSACPWPNPENGPLEKYRPLEQRCTFPDQTPPLSVCSRRVCSNVATSARCMRFGNAKRSRTGGIAVISEKGTHRTSVVPPFHLVFFFAFCQHALPPVSASLHLETYLSLSPFLRPVGGAVSIAPRTLPGRGKNTEFCAPTRCGGKDEVWGRTRQGPSRHRPGVVLRGTVPSAHYISCAGQKQNKMGATSQSGTPPGAEADLRR